MKLSTKGRYGARFMLDLALHHGEGPVLLKHVASRQELSEKYLGHLIPPLKTAGLVSSSRGAHGGYSLAKHPSEITLVEVVEAVEGQLVVAECVKSPEICTRSATCVARDVWSEVARAIQGVLGAITLETMVNRHNEKAESEGLTYSI